MGQTRSKLNSNPIGGSPKSATERKTQLVGENEWDIAASLLSG